MKNILFLLVGIVLLGSCKTPDLILDSNLNEQTTVMPVKGKQGFRINQKLSFGEFQTGKVKRSWTTSWNIPIIVKFRGAKEKLRFTITDGAGAAAEVFGLSLLKEKSIDWLSDFFSIRLDYKNHFAGTIAMNEGETVWDYIIFNPNAAHFKNVTRGFARSGEREIEIRGVKKLKGQANWINLDVYGYEFWMDGKSVGAVSIVNNGRVRMRDDLDSETRLVLAGLSSGLMLRENIEEEGL